MRDAVQRQQEFPDTAIGEPDIGAEKRGAPRFTLLIRTAKLITQAGEFLVVVRDASESGANVRIFHELPDCAGDKLLELQNGDRHPLELVWQDADRAGVRFLDGADIGRIIESPSRFSKRPIRVGVDCPAQLSSLTDTAEAFLHDLSQQGAKVSTAHRFSIDQRVRLKAPGLPEIDTKVRWRRDDCHGLVFEDTFQFGDLARIVFAMQNGGVTSPGARVRLTGS